MGGPPSTTPSRRQKLKLSKVEIFQSILSSTKSLVARAVDNKVHNNRQEKGLTGERKTEDELARRSFSSVLKATLNRDFINEISLVS